MIPVTSIRQFDFYKKNIVVFFYDFVIALISLPLAFSIRYGSLGLEILTLFKQAISILLISFLVKFIVFTKMGLYRGLWRFSSMPDLLLILKASGLVFLISIFSLFLYNRLDTIPRSLFVIDFLITLVGLGAGRFGYRIFKESLSKSSKGEKTIIIGAGSAGDQLIRDFKRTQAKSVNIVALLDDDPRKLFKTIQGVPVVGGISELKHIAAKTQATLVLMAIPSANRQLIRKIVNLCTQENLKIKTLPSLYDIVDGKVQVHQLRNVNEEDLLGREQVILSLDSIENLLRNQVVLVTGAGGSIGKELVIQIAKFNPKKLVLIDNGEFTIYRLEQEMRLNFPKIQCEFILADVRDKQRIRDIFSREIPQMVFHAAAYKHVPIMEEHPQEALKTNILGTKIIADESLRIGVERFVLISTDKAVNPTSVMGATKRIAEMYCQYLSEHSGETCHTKFMVVRFGNVLGSTGSVIPLFKEQIKRGGPITITHPEITRYFMSVSEAAQLVLEAGTMGHGGEIFVLEMGPPIKILDLAKDLIRLSGFKVGEDIKIEFVGLRPGEKLYEEVLADSEGTLPTSHPKVRKARQRPLLMNFADQFNELTLRVVDSASVKKVLKDMIPEYSQNQKLIIRNQHEHSSSTMTVQ